MSKSYRFKTNIGVDKEVRLNIEQDFDFLEILSLKLRQDDLYTRFCADYGVVAGRVVANGGLGVPNVSISIFVPISEIDENDPIISTLYPYKTPYDKNEDNYRYNLLPYTQEYGGHTPTGTFPTREDVLTRKEVLEVYEKYYKYTVRTNNSGDFMIVGVPLGSQKLVMDLDLSNIGPFSLRPSDLIRMGMGVPDEFNGQLFKSSEDLNSLPQILNNVVDIDVTPFWGQDDLCNVGITRFDFDLREMGVDITPHAIFMGSIFSSNEEDYLKSRCKPKKDMGRLCGLTTGPGTILSIRQTIGTDENGDPVLEEYKFEEGGNIIDENGVWLTELPMNLDYIVTNEFGEQVLSNDPTVGVPTSGKYRFRIKWQNEGTADDNSIYRADYLVPNIKEHGWINSTNIPTQDVLNKSYSFSLDWSEYYDKQSAINCEDTFYKFKYNKVYTIASNIDKVKWGTNRRRFIGIKDIEDTECQSEVNKYPINEGFKNSNFRIFIFNYYLTILVPLLYAAITFLHALAFVFSIFISIITIIRGVINTLIQFFTFGTVSLPNSPIRNPLLNLPLPMMTYPDCELCACKLETADTGTPNSDAFALLASYFGQGALIEPTIHGTFSNPPATACIDDDPDRQVIQMNFILSGYDNNEEDNKYKDLYNGDLINSGDDAEWYKSPTYPVWKNNGVGLDLWGCSSEPTWAQHLNLLNKREYFFGDSPLDPDKVSTAIQTTLINDQFPESTLPPSEPFLDNVFIMLMDNTTDLYPGDVLVFNNPENPQRVDDSNVNNTEISATTISNENDYVTLTVKSLNQDPILSNEIDERTIQVYNTGNINTYRHTVGVEYFQVITGMTGAEMNSLVYNYDPTNSVLAKHIITPVQTYGCDEQGTHSGPGGLPSSSSGNLAHKFGYNNFKVFFLVRGVDLHTPKQKIRYDLSKVFGYHGFNQSTFTGERIVEGEFYLNIPIQRNYPDEWFDQEDNWNYIQYWRQGGNKTPTPHHVRRYKMPNGSVPNKDFEFLDTYGTFNGANQSITDTYGHSYYPINLPNLYHPSYTLQVNGTNWSQVKSWVPAFYVSLDGSFLGPNQNGNNNPLSQFDNAYGKNEFSAGVIHNPDYPSRGINCEVQGHVSGVGYQFADLSGAGSGNRKVSGNRAIISMSPLYIPANFSDDEAYGGDPFEPGGPFIPKTIFSNPSNIVFRSDRLPAGDVMDFVNDDAINTEDTYFRRYALHMNAAFTIYKVEETGIQNLGNVNLDLQAFDESFNFQDEYEDISGTTLGNAISSFTCEGMKPFYCYDGICDTFEVQDPCTEEEGFGLTNITGDERVVNGCYVFLVKAPLFSLFLDLRMIVEYRTRLRFNYALCNGIINQSFFNNWVSGSLYLPSFQVNRIFSAEGDVKKYKYCGSPYFNIESLTYQGPIYYNTDTNSFYYRSTPYVDFSDGFIGQSPKRDYNSANNRNIWFPTTITELGPKDKFSSEISLTSEFQGYIMDKIKTTTYNDPSSIINLFAISRLTNSSLFAQLSNLGDASIDNLFSRDNRYVDGDYAQLVSINSEFGVIPFLEGNYEDSQLTFCEYQDGKPVIGIWFDSDVIGRRILGEGTETIGTNVLGLTSNFGYSNSQTIPYYKWAVNVQGNENLNLFGTEFNDWKTTFIYESKHQGTEFFSDSTNTYMYPDNLYGLGYIFNRDANGDPLNVLPNNTYTLNSSYKHGSPFHFYFGLKRGKSAVNKYIRKYILFE